MDILQKSRGNFILPFMFLGLLSIAQETTAEQ